MDYNPSSHMPQSSPQSPALQWRAISSPRQWQRDALLEWSTTLRGIVKVVTGAGKTIFAQQCMRVFHAKYPAGKTIIVVPTVALLDQWTVSLTEDLGVSDAEIACFSAEEKPTGLRRVNVFVLNTARKIGQYIRPEEETFLIVDECHRAGSLVNSLALKPAYTATLGLSATPERPFDTGFEERLVPALGEIIFVYDYAAAFRDRVIVPFELSNVKVSMLPEEEKEYRKLTARAALEFKRVQTQGYPDDKLRQILQRRAAVSASATMRIPVTAAIIDRNRGRRSLIFHERVEGANRLLDLLVKRKHSATIYHTGIGAIVRRDNLRLYRRGMFDVLISCRALDEGANIPEACLAVVASSTSSQRQRIQRLGRVLRPAEGKNVAHVYTLYATLSEEKRLQVEEEQLLGIATVTWHRSRMQPNG